MSTTDKTDRNPSDRSQKDLSEKVKEWLSGEGHPLEFATAHIFRKNQFEVHQGRYVRDLSSGTPREIDVLAQETVDTEDAFMRVAYVTECKWSKNKPWVIFTSNDACISPPACIAQTIASEVGEAILWALAGDENLQNLDTFSTPQRPGFNGRQAFSGENDLFYSAMQSVVSATSSLAQDYDQYETLKMAVVIFPIIVIDGRLFETFYDYAADELIVKEKGRIRLHWRGAESWSLHATVDVVTIDALDEYAARRHRDNETLFVEMEKSFREIRKCFEERSLQPLSMTLGARGVLGLPPLLAKLQRQVLEEELQRLPPATPD